MVLPPSPAPRLAALALLTCAVAPAIAGPLAVRNLGPVPGLFNFPSQHDARAADAGTAGGVLHTALASHYVRDSAPGEQLNLDGETLRVALELRYVPADRWALQLELPWVQQDEGFLDSAIDGWHEFWGMPDNGRGDVPRDLLDYRYADTRTRFDLRDSASGPGDIGLAVQYTALAGDAYAVALAAGHALGVGDAGDFTGGGEGDSWIALRASGDAADGALSLHAQLGYLRAGEIATLGPRQERDLWFAGTSVEWRLAQTWSLLGQLDTHAAPMDSALDALGDNAMLLSAGARWRFAPNWGLDLLVVEDIAVETGPDVIFQAALRYRAD